MGSVVQLLVLKHYVSFYYGSGYADTEMNIDKPKVVYILHFPFSITRSDDFAFKVKRGFIQDLIIGTYCTILCRQLQDIISS